MAKKNDIISKKEELKYRVMDLVAASDNPTLAIGAVVGKENEMMTKEEFNSLVESFGKKKMFKEDDSITIEKNRKGGK